jgi:hypothetical protein
MKGVTVQPGTAALAPEQFGVPNGGAFKPYKDQI